MIQCTDCEFYEQAPEGRKMFKCDPFVNIKEPECLSKWQILRLDMLLSRYQGVISQQQQMAPMQSKIMRYIERELDDLDESDKWKLSEDDQPNTDIDDPIL
jgi:hypothetical protein